MIQFFKLQALALCLILGFSTYAVEQGVIEIADNHKVYFKYQKAKKGKPTIVLLNGLIYSLDNWNRYFELMTKQDFGVVLFAYSTQPESLRELSVPPYFSEVEYVMQGARQKGATTQSLANELMHSIDALNIKDFHLLSLSYGSVVAAEMAKQYKHRIQSLIFAAPAVLASHRYNAWGKSRHAWYEAIRPNGDYYYDQEMYSSMFAIISAGNYSFPGVEFMDFFNGVFHMGSSAKWFDLKDYVTADLPPTHLFLASREDGPLLEDQLHFWELMKQNPTRGSFTMFEGGEHALPGIVPEAVAQITTEILNGTRKTGTEYKTVNESKDGDDDSSSSSN